MRATLDVRFAVATVAPGVRTDGNIPRLDQLATVFGRTPKRAATSLGVRSRPITAPASTNAPSWGGFGQGATEGDGAAASCSV